MRSLQGTALGPSLQASYMHMYVLLHMHIRQFTVLAVHYFFVVDEKNLQQLEKIVVDFFHLHHFVCLYEDESHTHTKMYSTILQGRRSLCMRMGLYLYLLDR
jgi:hypothetical protein